MADNYFKELYSKDVSEYTEKKNGLTYLSWAWAWAELKKVHPDATYKVYEREDGCIYWTDGKTAWVKTGVTVNGLEHIEYLPIMNYQNKSIPLAQITSFEVNKAIQRSLTKAVARHGLGLYVYAGEDLPEDAEKAKKEKKEEPETISEQEYYGLEELIKEANCNKDKLLQQYGLESFILLDRPRYEKLRKKLIEAVEAKDANKIGVEENG